jgi:uncharacterized DUF497 family protein
MQFEWNESKAACNLSKHGVSFEEAKTVFDDPLYVDFYDPDHSEDEERYLNCWRVKSRAIIDRFVYRKRRFDSHH